MLLSWVKSGLLFGIFASVLWMLCPNKSYMKHIGMVIGFIFILVMLHPVMEWSKTDFSTYMEYLQNVLLVEQAGADDEQMDWEFYEESICVQLKAAFLEKGYEIEDIQVESDSQGEIEKIRLRSCKNCQDLSTIEAYLKRLFGEDVKIIYE